MVTEDPPFLLMEGIVKRFPGALALAGVDLDIRAGEVHCVLGQNGAGKSTLIKVLAGAHQPTEGRILIDGAHVTLTTPVAALKAGIATMYQELDVVDGLSVAENVFLGHELATGSFINRHRQHGLTRDLLVRLSHPEIGPGREVASLSAAGKQIVSLARALSRNARLIVMDEPSAVLDSEEVATLHTVVRDITAQGIAVIYISHRLEEIREIGHRITVLKDGRTVAEGLPASTPTPELIELMTGRILTPIERRENVNAADLLAQQAHSLPTHDPALANGIEAPTEAGPILRVSHLCLVGSFADVTFDVAPGQVVGIAGLVGSGRSEILETIAGARKATSGEVHVAGVKLRSGNVGAAVQAGIGLCPEERKSQGLLLDEPIYRNLTLATFASFGRAGFLNEAREREITREQMARLELRPADPDRVTRTLSGGNQQKILLGRWLARGCRVLLLDEPTRGVDVGARAEIYELIGELARAGAGIVVVSSEIPEVLALADEVHVLSAGRIVKSAPASEINEADVLDLVMEGIPA